VGSNLDRVKPKIIKLVFVASLLSMQHLKRKSKDSLARNQDNVHLANEYSLAILFETMKTIRIMICKCNQ
jgi:hypothetical protein